jgi:putative DNA primase/helicase
MKNNLARTDNGLAFRLEQRLVGDQKEIVASAIIWEGEHITRTADEILAATDDGVAHRSAKEEAADWLQALLTDGPMAAKEIQAQTEAAGLSWATVRRAKDRLGIQPRRQSEGGDGSGKWVWSLPFQGLQGAQKTQDAHVLDVSTLQKFEHLGSGGGDQ